MLLSDQGSGEFNDSFTQFLTGNSREPFETYLEHEVAGVLQDQLWDASSIPRFLVDFLAPGGLALYSTCLKTRACGRSIVVTEC